MRAKTLGWMLVFPAFLPLVDVAGAAETQVTIGYAMGNGWIPAFVAKDQGIFARHGIDAQLQLMTNASNAPAALMAGTLQIAGLNPTAAILADDGGADIQVIANATIQTKTTSDGWLFARTGLDLHQPQDLIGRKVAVPAVNSVAHVALMRWLQLEKVDPKQVTYVEIPMNHIRDALRAGQVEAAIAVEPFSNQIEQSNAGYLMADFNAVLANPVTTHSVWAMLKPFIDAHPQIVSEFRQSLREAIVWIRAHPEEARLTQVTYLHLSDKAALPVSPEKYEPQIMPQMIQFWIDACRDLGLINGTLDPTAVIAK